MPLSDDELDGYERWFKYVQANMPYTYATEGIPIKGDVPMAILAELRAARKVVEAAKVLGIERAEAWRMAQHPKIPNPHTAAYLIIAEPLDELQAALAEYNLLNAASAESQKV